MPSCPRIVVAAPASNSGKTTVVLGLLWALRERGDNPVSFKCGPDYIDPMFHTRVLGVPSRNLDLFLAGRGEAGATTVRGLFAHHAAGAGISVVEGVMGFYDGVGVGSEASTWDVACALEAPVVLVVPARGAARSLAATVKGFMELEERSHVAGVILNGTSKMFYQMVKPVIEAETGVPCLGFLPKVPEASLESRHLGLVTAEEVGDLRARIAKLGQAAAESIDFDALLALAASAPDIDDPLPDVGEPVEGAPRIGVARDKAFCFYYQDNLDLLKRLGATLVEFSPLADASLPDNIDGLYLGGGYPELYEEQLSANASMLASVREAIAAGLPTFAECGGFMYLLRELDGHPMVGLIDGTACNSGKLQRFGYTTLTARRGTLLCEAGGQICAHEFHYWDSTANGDAVAAQKPSGRGWECVTATDTLWAGFPHLYLYGNPDFARTFVQKAARHRASQGA